VRVDNDALFVRTDFLAAFAMLYVIGKYLPKTDFLTLIDKVIIFTSAALAVSGLTSTFLFAYIERGVATNVVGAYVSNAMPSASSTSGDDAATDTHAMQERADAAVVVNDSIAIGSGLIFVLAQIFYFVPVIVRSINAKETLKVDFPVHGSHEKEKTHLHEQDTDEGTLTKPPVTVWPHHIYRTMESLQRLANGGLALDSANPVFDDSDKNDGNYVGHENNS
jgi:hypothetical protein